MYPCLNCGKENEHTNFCNWGCQIECAKKDGGKIYTPNNLPIRCIMADGTMLEVADGDHPDYKFPVQVEYLGDDEETKEYSPESHALIYTDDTTVALTIYESCYAIWHVESGKFLGGKLWDKNYKLSDGSLVKLIADRLEKLKLLK